jgi:hypothetical protein
LTTPPGIESLAFFIPPAGEQSRGDPGRQPGFGIDSCLPFLYNTIVDKISLLYPAPLTYYGGFFRPDHDPPYPADR